MQIAKQFIKSLSLLIAVIFITGCPSTKVSAEFAKKHPAGSYVTGELLVGMQQGTAPADSQKALRQAIPGLEVVKAMVNGTVFHVRLPATMNVEQGMAKLKTVKGVRYAELNGTTHILLGQSRPELHPLGPISVTGEIDSMLAYKVYVKGLVCPSCAVGLKKGLMKLPFIKSIHVNYKTGLVLIYEKRQRDKGGEELDKSRITKAVKDSGYEVDRFAK